MGPSAPQGFRRQAERWLSRELLDSRRLHLKKKFLLSFIIRCRRGGRREEMKLTYPIAFSSTPKVASEADSKYKPLKQWPTRISTTGFTIVVERDGGFTDEEIPVEWVAVKI